MEDKNQSQIKKVIVFSAHPDDHLCCAGTLMFLKDKGFLIEEVIATRGGKGPWWISETERKFDFKEEELEAARKQEINQASEIIGINRTIFLGLEDSAVSRNFEAIDKIISLIRQEKPEIIFFNNQKDYHCDHREFSKIVIESVEKASWNCFPEKGTPWKIPIVLMMEGFYFGKPHLVVDVTFYAERKNKVTDVYKSQIDSRERKLLESMNFYRAFYLRDNKVLLAEAFEIPEEIPIHFKRLVEIFSKV